MISYVYTWSRGMSHVRVRYRQRARYLRPHRYVEQEMRDKR